MWIERGVTEICVKQESPQTIIKRIDEQSKSTGDANLGTGTHNIHYYNNNNLKFK